MKRSPLSTLPLLAAWAAPLCLGRPAMAQETDTVYLRDGASEIGKVLEETLAGVTVQPERGPKKTVTWDNVQSVEYFDAPEELASALAALNAGNMENAMDQSRAVLAYEGLRPVIVQQALFHLAYAEQRLGKVEDALAQYMKLIQDFPKSRYLRLAGENLIELHQLMGNASGAQSALDKLAEGAKGVEGIDPVIGLLQARLLEGAGKFAEAGARFAAVEALAGINPTLAQEARASRARTLVEGGKGAEAEPLFRALIDESASVRVQSICWNGLGELQAPEGRAKKDTDRILEALYAYLRTVVLYKPLPGESTEEFERALCGAETCFKYLAELETNQEKKKLMRARQQERTDQLQRDFPNSIFLKKK